MATLRFATVAATVAAALLGIGYLVVDALLGAHLRRNEALVLSFAGTAGFALVVMVAHIATRGRVLSSTAATLVLSAAVVVVCVGLRLRRPAHAAGDGIPGWLVAVVICAAVLVWCSPVARMVPLDYGGDVHLHTGYAAQLLNGEPSPTATITGDIPNFYPWLTHALTAVTVRLTPGGSVYGALSTVQFVQVVGLLLALAGLGCWLGRTAAAGAFAALLGGLSGGFGFVRLRGLDIVIEPRTEGELYLGDLLYKRSYNASFFNMPPPFPRDVALTLLVLSVALVGVGLRRASTRLLAAGGATVGAAGLTGAEAFYVGFGAILVLIALPPRGLRRARLAGSLVIPALVVYSLWLVPQLLHFIELGGYQNITLVDPVMLSAPAVVVSWGLMTPLAAIGLWRALPLLRTDPCVRLVAALSVTGATAVASATWLSGLLGEAFLSIGRPHRYWPLLYLALALFAALGGVYVVERLRAGTRAASLAGGAAIALIALVSPVVATLALPGEKPLPRPLQRAVLGDRATLLNILGHRDGVSCNVAAPPDLTFLTQTYTGHRHVYFSFSPLHVGNFARIRWANIYDRVPADVERVTANRVLVTGHGGLAAWKAAVDRFDVDAIVIKSERADQLPFSAFPRETASDIPYTVVRLTDCTG